MKEHVVLVALQDAGAVKPTTVLPAISRSNLGYRRKMRMEFKGKKSKAEQIGVDVVFGPHHRHQRGLVDVSSCAVLDQRVPLLALRACLRQLECRDVLKEVSFAVGETAVAVMLHAYGAELAPADLMHLAQLARGM
jgi:tRNA/tmRNA/rRNA uracil-C5-methylase (TrmA/RlmC/RlmD family)